MEYVYHGSLRGKFNSNLLTLITSCLIINSVPTPLHSHCLTSNPRETKILYGDFFDLLHELDAKKDTNDVDGTIEIMFRIKEELERISGRPMTMKKYLKKVFKNINKNGEHISKEVMKAFTEKVLFIEHVNKDMGDYFYYVDRKFDEANPNWRNSPYQQENNHHPRIGVGLTLALVGVMLVCFPVIGGISVANIGWSMVVTGGGMACDKIIDQYAEDNWEPRKKTK